MRKWIIGTLLLGTTATGGVAYGDAQTNPYTDKGTHFELPITSDIPQGERVEIAKDRAEISLIGWNDEYNIKIRPQIPTAFLGADEKTDKDFVIEANRPLLSKRMEYKSGDVTTFIEPKSANEFDIDFTLDSKPDTNVFEYKIEGAEEFDFFPQGFLTPEEIAEGASRPENVEGSIAVYHKTKANHQIGKTNYAVGKAFHIYRPKAIDANGAEVSAELSFNNGTLSVTVPQKFLDEAVYPVRIDPTLGFTVIGGTSGNLGTSIIHGSNVQAIEDGDVTKISAYVKYATVPTNIKGVMTASSTLTILTNGVGGAVATPAVQDWTDSTFATSPTITSGVFYIPSVIPSNDQTTLYWDVVAKAGQFDTTNSYTSPADWGAASFIDRKLSIYATYTVAAEEEAAAPGDDFYFISW